MDPSQNKNYSAKLKISLNEFLSRRLITLQWESRYILILMFLVYGFFGWGSSTANFTLIQNVFYTLIVLISMYFAYRENAIVREWSARNFNFLIVNLLQVICLWLLIIVANYSWIKKSLSIDELYYSSGSHIHAYLVVTRLSSLLPDSLLGISGATYIRLISIFVVLGLLIAFGFLMQLKSRFTILMIVMFAVSCLRILALIQNASPALNSPMPFAWLLINSVLFGISDTGFRLSITLLMAVGLFVILCFLRGAQWHRYPESFIFVAVFLGIVGVHKFGVAVEIASFGFILNTVILAALTKNHFIVKPWMFLIVSIAFYFRVPSVFLLGPLIALRIIEIRSLKRVLQELFVPLVILFPGLISITINRLVPSISSSDSGAAYIGQRATIMFQVLVDTGMIFYLLVILLIRVLLKPRTVFSKMAIIFAISYSLSAFFMFCLFIPTQVTFAVKYSYEYLLPLVFMLSFSSIKYMQIRKSSEGSLKAVGLTSSTFIAVLLLFMFQSENLGSRQRHLFEVSDDTTIAAQRVYSVTPFDYRGAYRFIAKLGVDKNCMNTGPTYSAFVEILGGLTFEEFIKAKDLRVRYLIEQALIRESWLDVSIKSLESSGANCAVVGPLANRGAFLQELQSSEWVPVWSSIDSKLGTKTMVVARIRQ